MILLTNDSSTHDSWVKIPIFHFQAKETKTHRQSYPTAHIKKRGDTIFGSGLPSPEPVSSTTLWHHQKRRCHNTAEHGVTSLFSQKISEDDNWMSNLQLTRVDKGGKRGWFHRFFGAPWTGTPFCLCPELHTLPNTQWSKLHGSRTQQLPKSLASTAHTCGMPYWSMTCQMYQSSFRDVFLNRKVVTKAYSSGRPWGNTSLRIETDIWYQDYWEEWRVGIGSLQVCSSTKSW